MVFICDLELLAQIRMMIKIKTDFKALTVFPPYIIRKNHLSKPV